MLQGAGRRQGTGGGRRGRGETCGHQCTGPGRPGQARGPAHLLLLQARPPAAARQQQRRGTTAEAGSGIGQSAMRPRALQRVPCCGGQAAGVPEVPALAWAPPPLQARLVLALDLSALPQLAVEIRQGTPPPATASATPPPDPPNHASTPCRARRAGGSARTARPALAARSAARGGWGSEMRALQRARLDRTKPRSATPRAARPGPPCAHRPPCLRTASLHSPRMEPLACRPARRAHAAAS